MPVVRGKRVPPHSNANATRKRIVRTSAMPTAPATFQCTFSQVMQKSVARKRAPVSFMRDSSIPAVEVGGADGRASEPARPEVGVASDASCECSQDVGQLLDARAPSETLPVLVRKGCAVERSRAPAPVQLHQRRAQRL